MKYLNVIKMDKGNIRDNNEDNYYIDSAKGTYAVFDGMGGIEYGEVASEIASLCLKDYDISLGEKLNEYLFEANKRVYEKGQEISGKTIGTTVVLVHFDGDKAAIANIGDSRIYRYRNGSLEQLSQDHTIVYQMYLKGKLTKEQARTHKNSHILYQHLGMSLTGEGMEPFILEDIKVLAGDRFLLCSDGLTDMLPEEEIQNAFKLNMDIEYTAEVLMTAALEAGGRDNITVLIIEAQ